MHEYSYSAATSQSISIKFSAKIIRVNTLSRGISTSLFIQVSCVGPLAKYFQTPYTHDFNFNGYNYLQSFVSLAQEHAIY